MELFVETNGFIFDISDMCTKISWTDQLNDGADYLEFSYIYDEQVGIIERGAPVRLSDNGQSTGIFYGIVFKADMSDEKVVSVRAYSRLRYLKTKDTIVVDRNTLNTLVRNACQFFQFPVGVNTNTGYLLPDSIYSDKTWLDIIYTGISDTLIGTGHYYCLRDEYGVICLRDMQDLQLPLVIGDDSLAYKYSYSASIDEEFYNQIKIVAKNETTGKADVYLTSDSDSVEQYGLLQYYEVVDDGTNQTKAKEKANNLLRLYNREMEKLSFSCLGDLSVRAGCSIYGSVSDIKLDRRLIVNKVTHNFLPAHTMNVEVMI